MMTERSIEHDQYPRLRWLVLLTILLSSVCSGMTSISFTPLVGVISKDLGIDLGTASFGFLGITTFVAVVGIVLSGFVIDRLGIYPILIGSQLVFILSYASLPFFGHSYGNVVLIRVIQGLCVGGITAATTPGTALWFPRHEIGRAMGIQTIGIPLGILLGLNVSPLFFTLLGSWQAGIAMLSLIALVALVVTVPVAIISRRYQPVASRVEKIEEAGSLAVVLRLPIFWIGLMTLALASWVGIVFSDLAPGFLAVAPPIGAGYGPQASGQIISFFTIAGIAGPPISGFLVDNVFGGRNRIVILIGWALGAVFYTAILFPVIYSNPLILTPIVFLAGFSNPFVNPLLMGFAAKIFPPHMVGRVAGLWLSVAFLVGALGISVGSFALHATGTYQVSIIIVGGGCVMGLFLSLFLKPPVSQPTAEKAEPVQPGEAENEGKVLHEKS
jgi:MFS family permease